MCATQTLSLTSDELLKRPDLLAVDGVLYDVKGYAEVHPGSPPTVPSGPRPWVRVQLGSTAVTAVSGQPKIKMVVEHAGCLNNGRELTLSLVVG